MSEAAKDWRGRFYEDFTVGDVFRSRLGRTVTEVDNIWFTCLTLNTNQIHFNTPYSERTQFGKPLVNSAFTLALVTGMTVPDTSENAAANLQWTDIKLPKPVFAGDTLWAESEILDLRESQSNPKVGIVTMRCARGQPAPRGRDRVQANVHGLQAGRARGRAHLPRHRHRLERPMTAAQTIAEWATTLSANDVPEDVATHAKLHFLDTIGCGYAASALGIATEGRTTMAELGGEGQSSVIGFDGALPAPNAAFANGMICHGLDFDDTHADSVSHVSVVVCPAALATAEAQGASGAELLAAIVVGNEIVTRVGAAASGLFHARGFHPTARSVGAHALGPTQRRGVVQHDQRQRSVGRRARQAAHMRDDVELGRAGQHELDGGLIGPGEVAVGGRQQRVDRRQQLRDGATPSTGRARRTAVPSSARAARLVRTMRRWRSTAISGSGRPSTIAWAEAARLSIEARWRRQPVGQRRRRRRELLGGAARRTGAASPAPARPTARRRSGRSAPMSRDSAAPGSP